MDDYWFMHNPGLAIPFIGLRDADGVVRWTYVAPEEQLPRLHMQLLPPWVGRRDADGVIRYTFEDAIG